MRSPMIRPNERLSPIVCGPARLTPPLIMDRHSSIRQSDLEKVVALRLNLALALATGDEARLELPHRLMASTHRVSQGRRREELVRSLFLENVSVRRLRHQHARLRPVSIHTAISTEHAGAPMRLLDLLSHWYPLQVVRVRPG